MNRKTRIETKAKRLKRVHGLACWSFQAACCANERFDGRGCAYISFEKGDVGGNTFVDDIT